MHDVYLVVCLLLGNNRSQIEYLKTRFPVYRIRELVPDLDDEQKKWITESDHGALLCTSKLSIPVKLDIWIMKHIDPLLSEFRLWDEVIVFDRTLVCKILGFENGSTHLNLSVDVVTVEDFLKIYDQHRERIRAKIKKCIEVLIFHLKILSKLDLSCCMGRSAKCRYY